MGVVQKKQDVQKKKKDDFLKIPDYSTETKETYTDNDSYWWVLVEDRDGGTRRNAFIRQNHQYFSYDEVKQSFTKDCFILNFIRVDKETYIKNQK